MWGTFLLCCSEEAQGSPPNHKVEEINVTLGSTTYIREKVNIYSVQCPCKLIKDNPVEKSAEIKQMTSRKKDSNDSLIRETKIKTK